VKFHPTDSNFVASGCLGCEVLPLLLSLPSFCSWTEQVRVWDIAKKQCRSIVRLEFSIISLAFQPSLNGDCGPYIAVASGPHLHMWEWKNPVYNVRQGTQIVGINQHENLPSVMHSRNIRAVMFHPSGKVVFAAAPDPPRLSNAPSSPCRLYAIQANKEFITSLTETMSLSSFPAIIPQVSRLLNYPSVLSDPFLPPPPTPAFPRSISILTAGWISLLTENISSPALS
jgi:WD40 repeat protein